MSNSVSSKGLERHR